MKTPQTDTPETEKIFAEHRLGRSSISRVKVLVENLERRAIAAEAKLAKWESELSKVMPADFKDWWQNSREEWPEIARMVIEGLRKQVEMTDKAAEARAKELEAANTDLIQRLQERVESYLASSKRDVQTIQQQAVELDRLRASLRLRPIAEAGPVPDGMIRLYAHRIPYGPCGGDFWAAFSEPGEEDTDYIDIYPKQQ